MAVMSTRPRSRVRLQAQQAGLGRMLQRAVVGALGKHPRLPGDESSNLSAAHPIAGTD